MMKRLVLSTVAACIALASWPTHAQNPGLADQRGYVGLGLLLRHLNTVGVFMQATAHPDDENNALFVMLNRGKGFRTVLATATRSDGGQNEIGPELFDALGVLRTEELLALHRYDGAEQYFTRAVDFGYSFSVDETFEKWGKREIVGDYVRLIRMTRPDVITAMSPAGSGGGQHHQASALLSKDAFRAAGDPNQYPEQLNEGLRPWQAKKFYFTAGFPFPGAPPPPPGAKLVPVDAGVYDSLLGTTYTELGVLSRSMHKCQGMAQLLALPGTSFTFRYALVDTTIPGEEQKQESTLFDGVDTTIPGLAQYAAGTAPQALIDGLAAIASSVAKAQNAFDTTGADGARPLILSGLTSVRALRGRLPSLELDEAARFEIDSRLKLKEDQFEEAAVLASGLRLEALADDGLVTPGESLKASVIVADRGANDVLLKQVRFEGLEGGGRECSAETAVKSGAVFKCEAALRVPESATLTGPYWHRPPNAARYEFEPDAPFGAPFRPTPFRVTLVLDMGGEEVTATLPIQYRYEGNIFSGEKRMELTVVPRFAVRVSPETAIIPVAQSRPATATRASAASVRADREVRVTVTNGLRGEASGDVSLVLPAGWRSAPASAPVTFARED